MKKSIVFLLLLSATGCKKLTSSNTYTIKGQLLESSSNPIPVADYTLSFYQSSIASLLGVVKGFDKTIKTNGNGTFMFRYSSSSNDGTISMTGTDTVKYKNMYPEWFPIYGLTNVDLKKVYLFKKIDRLVRKVQFTTPLNSGEVLEVITNDSSGASYGSISGPVNAGTLLTVDTIVNCKLSSLNILTRTYVLWAVLKKPSFQKDFDVVLTEGDEQYREVLMIY
jgi:hypothetical protein